MEGDMSAVFGDLRNAQRLCHLYHRDNIISHIKSRVIMSATLVTASPALSVRVVRLGRPLFERT